MTSSSEHVGPSGFQGLVYSLLATRYSLLLPRY